MKHELIVSSEVLVVGAKNIANDAELRNHLATFGFVTELAGHEDVVSLKLDRPDANAKKSWRQIRKSVDAGIYVGPVYFDAKQTPKFATGAIVVRFADVPSEDELTAWESTFGLKVHQRNEFVPAQIHFHLTDLSRQYVPEVIQHAEEQAKGAAVWPETLSKFERL